MSQGQDKYAIVTAEVASQFPERKLTQESVEQVYQQAMLIDAQNYGELSHNELVGALVSIAKQVGFDRRELEKHTLELARHQQALEELAEQGAHQWDAIHGLASVAKNHEDRLAAIEGQLAAIQKTPSNHCGLAMPPAQPLAQPQNIYVSYQIDNRRSLHVDNSDHSNHEDNSRHTTNHNYPEEMSKFVQIVFAVFLAMVALAFIDGGNMGEKDDYQDSAAPSMRAISHGTG
jgi:hypothetical protein